MRTIGQQIFLFRTEVPYKAGLLSYETVNQQTVVQTARHIDIPVCAMSS